MTKIFKGQNGTVEYSPEYETFYAYKDTNTENEGYCQFSMTKAEFKEMISNFFNVDEE